MRCKRYAYLRIFVEQNKGRLFLALMLGCLGVLCTLSIPIFVGKFYQLVLHTHSQRGQMFDLFFTPLHQLTPFFISFGLLIVAKGGVDGWYKYQLGLLSERLARDVREALFRHQLHTTTSAFRQKESGKYLLRYSGDLNAIQNYITKGQLQWWVDLVHVGIAFALLWAYHAYLALMLLAAFPVLFVVMHRLNQSLQQQTARRRDQRSSNLSFVSARLQGHISILTLNRQDLEVSKFERRSAKLYQLGLRYQKRYAFQQTLLPSMLYLLLLFMLMGIAWHMQQASQSVEGHDLVAFVMIFVGLIAVFKRLLAVSFVWKTGQISLEKIRQLLDKPTENIQKNRFKTNGIQKLSLHDVHFGYPQQPPLFTGLYLEVQRHQSTLLLGQPAQGKSSIFKLILGLYPMTKGDIRFDHQLVTDQLWWLRKNISIASDEFPLLGNTLFEAISYTRQADKKAGALAMLIAVGYVGPEASLDALDSPLFESGKNLSNSQRKLLLMARALLTRKPFILLDEPFAGLNVEQTNRMCDLLHAYKKRGGLLVIDSVRPAGFTYDKIVEL